MINYSIYRIAEKIAKEYIHKNHYSHGSHNHPHLNYGLYDRDALIGVCMFAQPCSEYVRAYPFGKEEKDRVLELHRLHILDVTLKNTESYFIAKCLKATAIDLENIKCILAYSDPSAGHTGIIYRATNALYLGRTPSFTFYMDKDKRLHHPRQNTKNISKEQALERGWIPVRRGQKYRYAWIIGKNKQDKRYWRKKLIHDSLPYP